MGNLRIPRMRISSEHVAGMLRFLDRQAEAKAAPISTPKLRFPEDFPGARPTLQRDLQLLDQHGSDADVMIELDALYEDSAAAMIASVQGIEAAESSLNDFADGLGSSAVERPTEGTELGDQVAPDGISDGLQAIAPVQIRPQTNPSPKRVPAQAPVATVRHVQPARQVGKTAAQERLFSSLPLTSKKVAAPSITLRPDPLAERRERLNRAIVWLKREHRILVTVVDREALVRQYLVSGKRDRMLADHVIDYAVSLGMPING